KRQYGQLRPASASVAAGAVMPSTHPRDHRDATVECHLHTYRCYVVGLRADSRPPIAPAIALTSRTEMNRLSPTIARVSAIARSSVITTAHAGPTSAP